MMSLKQSLAASVAEQNRLAVHRQLDRLVSKPADKPIPYTITETAKRMTLEIKNGRLPKHV